MKHVTCLPVILEWDGPIDRELDALETEYTGALYERFGAVLGLLLGEAPDRARSLLAELSTLDAASFDRLLRRPETSRRLTLCERYPLSGTLDYLRAAADAQREALADEPAPLAERLAALVDHGDLSEGLAAATVEGLKRVAALAATAVPGAMTMVLRCAREIHLRSDPSVSHFRSNSPQGCVGRAVFTNCGDADDVALVEALVHEAIHGLVGMSEAVGLVRGPSHVWLADPYPYDGASRVRSPWTGTPLDLPTYLHAVFVWYGLLGFWTRVYPLGLWPEARVRSRVQRALCGFVRGAAIAEIEPFRGIIAPQLFDTLTQMSGAVHMQLDEALP